MNPERLTKALCGLAVLAIAGAAQAQDRVSMSEKGSLLIFPKVELRWNDSGDLVQDTFITLTNDYPDDVRVQMFYVMGDPEWNKMGVVAQLTANQPTYWSAESGRPLGTPPFTILSPGDPPGVPDPEGGTDYVLRGFIVAWAVDSLGAELCWNHLSGEATIVNYRDGAAWEYKAAAYQALNCSLGTHTDGSPGILRMNGSEYDYNFSLLLLDFYASQQAGLSDGVISVVSDTDLTLLPVGFDFRQDGDGPLLTKVKFDIWNMNEIKFSGTERCVTCWDQALVSSYQTPNHFMRDNLQTDKGKARIDGVGSIRCPDSVNAPLLAVSMKLLDFAEGSTDFVFASARAGSPAFGMGTDGSAVIRTDDVDEPPPTAPVVGQQGEAQADGMLLEVRPRR